MKPSELFDTMQNKLGELFKQAPFVDLKHNLRANVSQCLSKLDLVTREEFDVQTQVLARTRARLEILEAQLAKYEATEIK